MLLWTLPIVVLSGTLAKWMD